MRLIDADAFEVFVKTVRQGLYLDKTLSDIPTRDSMLLNFQQYVHLQPTIDAVPVVRGEWVEAISYDPNKKVQCQNCYKMAYEPTPYCPNCGADMRGET